MDLKRLQLNEMNNKPKFIWAGQKKPNQGSVYFLKVTF